jgi:hypothetical protein
MKRYVIMAKENYPGAVLREICRCDTNAKVIRDALADYTVTGSQGTRIYKFNHVEILELSPRKPREARAQMKKPIRNVDTFSGKPSANQIACVLEQIDAMRAGNGEQAAQGPAAEARPPLPIGKSEIEQ